jgi:hypothetical protein
MYMSIVYLFKGNILVALNPLWMLLEERAFCKASETQWANVSFFCGKLPHGYGYSKSHCDPIVTAFLSAFTKKSLCCIDFKWRI